MEKLTTEQKAKNAILWIDRLSTTQVKQGRGKLGNSSYGYCCLGYGCMVLRIPFSSDDSNSYEFRDSIGLRNANGNVNKSPFLDKNEDWLGNSLIDLNDDQELSFRRISTKIKSRLSDLFDKDVAKILVEHYNK